MRLARLLTSMPGLILAVMPFAVAAAAQESAAGVWPKERAAEWYRTQPWLVGCNFLPSTAVNDVEMWRRETFDPATIDRELGWARSLGYNSVRVFVNSVVWEADAEGLRERFAKFLDIAAKHRISAMPVLLDDCNFAGREAKAAPQPDPIPGVHNSQWVSSPPLGMVTDRAAWPKEVERLLGEAAQLAATYGLPSEAFMAAAWEQCLDSHPGLREELEDKELRSQLKKLRKRGLLATA